MTSASPKESGNVTKTNVDLSEVQKSQSVSESNRAASDFGEKVLKQTENRLVGMAVGGIARATLGRVPVAGPILGKFVPSCEMLPNFVGLKFITIVVFKMVNCKLTFRCIK